MTDMRNKAVMYIKELSEDKLRSAVDYLRYLSERDDPLDDYDYELAKLADLDESADSKPFDVLLKEVGLTFMDCQFII